MLERKYRICITVPLGERVGTMMIKEKDDCIDGWIDIMNERNTISGIVSSDGQVVFSGTLKTLMNNFNFTASGYVKDKAITLTLKTDFGIYYSLTGEEYQFDE